MQISCSDFRADGGRRKPESWFAVPSDYEEKDGERLLKRLFPQALMPISANEHLQDILSFHAASTRTNSRVKMRSHCRSSHTRLPDWVTSDGILVAKDHLKLSATLGDANWRSPTGNANRRILCPNLSSRNFPDAKRRNGSGFQYWLHGAV